MLWSQKFGPDQEAFYTILAWDPGDGEIELILKAQGSPMECNSVLLDYYGDALHAPPLRPCGRTASSSSSHRQRSRSRPAIKSAPACSPTARSPRT